MEWMDGLKGIDGLFKGFLESFGMLYFLLKYFC